MYRQLYQMGGETDQLSINEMMIPRNQYGLGSLVKSVTKGVKGLVGGIKDFTKSDAGKLALLLGAGYLTGGGGIPQFLGGKGLGSFQFANIPGASKISNLLGGEKTLGKTLKVFAGGSLLGGLLSKAEETGDPENITRNVDALRIKLADAYKNQRTFSDEADENLAISEQVERDVAEYSNPTGIMAAYGGRIGYQVGGGADASRADFKSTPKTQISRGGGRDMVMDTIRQSQLQFQPQSFNSQNLFAEVLKKDIQNLKNKKFKGLDYDTALSIGVINPTMTQFEFEQLQQGKITEPGIYGAANGGRIGYALGNSEDNAVRASKMMNLPLNKNKAGITELDLRKTGGFIPPVGVKEKADDIPAMLSNNEFVFTADAVRNAGDGDVNKGAQRMYDMMKKLENRKIT